MISAAILVLIGCALPAQNASAAIELNLALFPTIPRYESFETTVRACWEEKHPEVGLNFVDWDCYSDEVPDDLDAFVFDTICLDKFAGKGCLLPLLEEEIEDYDDLIRPFVEGCRVDGKLYTVPQFVCTDLLYTRKGDPELENVDSIDGLYGVLKDDGLLVEDSDSFIQGCRYLQAMIDDSRRYMDRFPPIAEGYLHPGALEPLESIQKMRQRDSEGLPKDGELYPYARRFAEDTGRAYIGYSEAMDMMGEGASEMDFRLFSMSKDGNIPVFYVDVAAVNAKISDQKKTLALELLNLITGTDLLVRASRDEGEARYLLSARASVYDVLGSGDPIYAELQDIVSVPEAQVFRIKPDGIAYLETADNNSYLLCF